MPPQEGGAGGSDPGPPAPGQGAPDGVQGQGAPDGGQQPGSDDSAAVIARLNAEAKDWRKKFEAEQSRVKEFELAQMSELEKANARIADEEAKRVEAERLLQSERLSGRVREAATKAGALDPDLVIRAVDLQAVELDANGQPKNVDALVNAVKKAHPVLFGQANGSADGGARGGSSPGGDMNELLRRAAGRS